MTLSTRSGHCRIVQPPESGFRLQYSGDRPLDVIGGGVSRISARSGRSKVRIALARDGRTVDHRHLGHRRHRHRNRPVGRRPSDLQTRRQRPSNPPGVGARASRARPFPKWSIRTCRCNASMPGLASSSASSPRWPRATERAPPTFVATDGPQPRMAIHPHRGRLTTQPITCERSTTRSARFAGLLDLPGMVVVVAQDGKIIHQIECGHADVEARRRQ